jgi:predicted membrane-bound dolichyl-phosphate-mannose-protein mannosyltransferase
MIKLPKKPSIKSFRISPILAVLGLGLIVRIILGFFGTLNLDQGTFIGWSNSLIGNDFSNFYKGWSDYLPGYIYILWFLGKVRGFIPNVLLYKLPAIFADLATGFLIYKIVGKFKDKKWALIASSLYIFNPAILSNSTLWGQIDSITSLLSLLAIYFVPVNFFLSSFFLAFGTLVKPQVAFIAVVIFLVMIKNKWKPAKILSYVFSSLIVFVLGFLPFTGKTNILSFITERLSISSGQYPYTSVNAFNFWGVFGFWNKDSDTFPLMIIGVVIVLIILGILLLKVWKKKGWEYFLASVVFLSSFLFLTRIHERHLLPVFAPLIISASLIPDLLIPYVGLSLTYLANMYYSYMWITYDFKNVFPQSLIVLFILINLFLLGIVFWKLFRENGSEVIQKIKEGFLNFKKRPKNIIPFSFSETKLSKRFLNLLLAGVLLFAFATRIFELGSPKSEYFDEVYHAFTAREILHGNKMAWEWWNTPPQGFAYEWTHPPLAKLGMVLGMEVFGENAFGWRIVQAILGTGSVLLIYLISKELFKDQLLAIIAASVFSLDGLSLVMSRIGMNDTYMLFFMLFSLYFFIKEKDFLSSFGFGLALASKWSVIWVIPILFVLWLRRKKKFKLSLIWYIVVPPLMYLATYLPMFLTGHGIVDIWWGMQKQMWWYHTRLRATHPYTSSWWSWPFLIRPIYLYTSSEVGGMVSRIYAMGNPIIFWFGLVSIVISFIYSFLERNKRLALIVFSYLIFFVPWAASPRIMFLYHYLPSIPFLAIATAYVLRRNPKLMTGFLVVSLMAFIYFYPHFTGLNIPIWLDKSYYWFSSWR